PSGGEYRAADRAAGAALGGEHAGDVQQRRLAPPERLDHLRIELGPGLVEDLGPGLAPAPGPPVGAVARHRVERVAEAEDARPERDLFGGQPVGIAAAVPPLVMRPDDPDPL